MVRDPKLMTDLDDCAPWLQQAWVELKAPLSQGDFAPLPHSLDPALLTTLLQVVCQGDIATAHRLCQQFTQADAGRADMQHALSLILPVIEQIERDWQADRRSYTDTLYAFWNVQRLLQTWSVAQTTPTEPLPGVQRHAGRALMASVPGSLHHLGALVVADHFRGHGWQVQTLIDATADQLIQAVRDGHCDVLGLSVGHDAGLQGLADLIRSLRAAAPATPPRIVLGGPVFSSGASGFAWLVADGIATSAQQALIMSAQWVQHKFH